MSVHFKPQTDILVIHRKDAPPSYMHPISQNKNPHFHYQYELLLNIAGIADYEIGGKLYHIRPGSLLFISNMENHCISKHSEKYERYFIRFSSEALAHFVRDPALLSVFKMRPKGFCHQYFCTEADRPLIRQLAALMEREYQEQQPYWDTMIAQHFLTILIRVYRRQPDFFPAHQRSVNHQLIFSVQSYIESHVGENLSLDEVASRFFVSKYHLSHSFSDALGYTYKHFVVIARMSKAKDMLINTNEKIAAISKEVGFENVSHFIYTFKRVEDMTPLQYRSQFRKKA